MIRIFSILFLLSSSANAFDLSGNMEYYTQIQNSYHRKHDNDFNIHISLVGHPEMTASETNLQNIDRNAIFIRHDYKNYMKDGFDFSDFQSELLVKIETELKNADKHILSGKDINFIVPHMINVNRPENIDMSNKYAYYVNVETGYIFQITPKDYAVFIENIVKKTIDCLLARSIKIGKIHYISPACSSGSEDISILLKNYKTNSAIASLKIGNQTKYVEKAGYAMSDVAIDSILKDETFIEKLKKNSISFHVSFCKADHCYNRIPEDMLRFVNDNKEYNVGEMLYNGVNNFVLGAVSLYAQDVDNIGFVSEDLVKKIQKDNIKLKYSDNASANIIENPSLSGKSIQDIVFINRSLKKYTIKN